MALIPAPPAERGIFVGLVLQADQLGYLVSVWPDEVFVAPVEVDHDAKVIAVDGNADPEQVIPALMNAVDEIVSRPGHSG